MWTSDATRSQYSYEPLVRNIFGATRATRARSSSGAGFGRGGGQPRPRRRDVVFPAEPRQREALLLRVAVAELAPRGEVEAAEHSAAAAVRHLEEDRAVGLGWIEWTEQVELRGVLDFAALVHRREFEVADDAVGGELGVGSEIDAAGEALVPMVDGSPL